jgi:hypothetical protein
MLAEEARKEVKKFSNFDVKIYPEDDTIVFFLDALAYVAEITRLIMLLGNAGLKRYFIEFQR